MKKRTDSWVIAAAIVLAAGMLSLASAQGGPFLPFSVGGYGIAANVSQCPTPAPNFAALCPVAGQGWMQTYNGSTYALLIGPAGAAATVAVGTVSTLPPGSNATVTNAGTSTAAVFNIGIPAGQNGTPGPNWTNCPVADLSQATGLTVSNCK